MADTTVQLGTVTFKDFEVPSEIPYGGEHATKVHKLLGGVRVVDALGRDDKEIVWSGRCQGSDAQARIDAMDQMRVDGTPQTLTWGSRSYTVIVSGFDATWQRVYQILFTIRCTVVQDNSIVGSPPVSTLDDLISGDMDAATILSNISDSAPVIDAVSGLQSAIDAVGTLQGASLTVLGPIAAVAQGALSTIDGVLGGLDLSTFTDAGSVAGVIAGGFAPAVLNAFEAQVAGIGQQATVQEVRSLVGRVQINLAQATG